MAEADKVCDVLVIGAGIIGCTIAHALTVRGFKVVMIDSGVIGGGTSSASFSWINATSKIHDPEYFHLNALGLRLYLDWARQWGAHRIGLHQAGMIEWADAQDSIKLKALKAMMQQLNAANYSTVWLERAELAQLEPKLLFEEGAEGLLVARDCWLDVPRFLAFLVTRLRQSGTRVIERCCALELIADDSGKVAGVQTDAERYTCSSVVVATGAHTADVLSRITGYDGFRSRFPIRQAPGLLVTTPPQPSGLVKHILYSAHSSGLHVRDAGQGRLLVGADDADGVVAENNAASVLADAAQMLLTRLSQLIPDFKGSVSVNACRIDVGTRAVPTDGRSIAGPALAAEGLYLAVTHSGITLALVLAELVADCIDSGSVPDQLLPYSLDRFDS